MQSLSIIISGKAPYGWERKIERLVKWPITDTVVISKRGRCRATILLPANYNVESLSALEQVWFVRGYGYDRVGEN